MLRERLLRRVPARHRPLAARLFVIATIAFLAFEAVRALSIGRLLLPTWEKQMAIHTAWMTTNPPDTVAVGLAVTAVAFVIPMAALFFALRYARRRFAR